MRELRRLSAALLTAYALVAFAAFYWSVVSADALRQREDNPRRIEAEAAIWRGEIYDRRGFLLATTTVTYDGLALRRLYPHPEVAPATGYYSRRYGVSGIEADYDALLRGAEGPTPFEEWQRQVVHLPTVGGDVRLTLDLGIQAAAARALGAHSGAVVLATIPDGAIRAMVSAPIFDPNTLDESWEKLVTAPDAPLLNRATQGVYQPGGLLQTVLLATALSRHAEVDLPLPGGADPVTVNGLTLTCLQTPPPGDLTLREAYVYGCPGAFAQTTALVDAQVVQAAFWRLGLLLPPTLNSLQTETSDSPLALSILPDEAALTAALVGQGALTVTPLQALGVMAAIANQGNLPSFRLVDATRLPGEENWSPVRQTGLARAVLTRQTAEQIQLAMQTAAASGNAAAAQAETRYPLLGHTAAAFSGPQATPLYWFSGMIRFDDGSAVVVNVVLEDAASADEAARVGGQTLDAAARLFAPSTAD